MIWPGDMGEFDLLNILADHPDLPRQARYPSSLVPSDLDLSPPPMLITSRGVYTITYEVYAENFPKLQFQIRVNVSGGQPQVTLI